MRRAPSIEAIFRLASVALIVFSISLWYLFLLAVPLYSKSESNSFEEGFSEFYGLILFMAVPTLIYTFLPKIINKSAQTAEGLFVLTVLASWVNMYLWIFNTASVYEIYKQIKEDYVPN